MLQEKIEDRLKSEFNIISLALENESHMHSGNAPESHFKLTLVTDDFKEVSKVKRHQSVYRALNELMPQFHALAMHLYTQDEWEIVEVPVSPKCMGGH